MTPLRLQKLLYYVQGWSLAVRDCPMFPSRIAAWSHGPVVTDVYPLYADEPTRQIPGHHARISPALSPEDRGFVDSVWESYRKYTASELRRMTHAEAPWRNVWGDRAPDDLCDEEITQEAMADFFRQAYEQRQVPGLELEKLARARAAIEEGSGVPLTEVLPRLRNAL